MERGEGKTFRGEIFEIPEGCQTFTGVDLGVKQTLGANVSCMFTILVHPDETREVICIESGKWTAPEIIDRLKATYARYKSTIFVENNAAQDFIVQFVEDQDARIPIRRFHTGSNKMHPQFGVESIGAELAGHKWIIPSYRDSDTGRLRVNSETQTWIDQMLYYDPKGHTGDHLMACWFAKEGARKSTFTYRVALLGGNTYEGEVDPYLKEKMPPYKDDPPLEDAPEASAVWDELRDMIEIK
jgi:hypothetical protein